MEKRIILAMAEDELTPEQRALFVKDINRIEASIKAVEQKDWKRADQIDNEWKMESAETIRLRTKDYKAFLHDFEREAQRQAKQRQISEEKGIFNQKKLDRANQLINEKAEVQADGSLRISSEDWRGINRKLNEGKPSFQNIFNKLSEVNEEIKAETAAMQKQGKTPLPERRNINSKENIMSDVDEIEGQARNPKEEAFLNTVHQRKVITDALKAGKLSCLPGEDGFADTQPAVNLVNGTFYHGTNLLFLKEHQKENGFPSAEYVTMGQIEKARQDNPDLFIRKGQKGVSIYVSEKNEETGEWENKSFRLFNVAQTTKPANMKEWAEQQRQEKLQEKLEYLQTQYGAGYKLPEPKEKVPGPEISCSSTDPKEYLGQYLAAVSMGGKFKASPEQAAEFAQKLEGTLFERMDNGHTNPFKLEKISIEASQHCKEVIKGIRMDTQKVEQPQQQQEQTQSHSHHM